MLHPLSRFGLVLGLTLAVTASAASENPVLYWSNQAVNATRLSRNPPPIAALHFASLHVAIFDTVNSFEHTHQGWLVNDPAPAGADPDAALHSAAYTVLSALWADAANPRVLRAAYDEALAAIPDGEAKQAGLAWGKRIAEAVMFERAKVALKPGDRDYTSRAPGKWRETPPGFRPPVTPRLGEVAPFALESSSQFRAPPPLPHDSPEYAAEIAYVNKVGPRDGAERTEYQTLSTPFWSDDLGSATPPGHWNVIASDIVHRLGLDTYATARLFALINIAGADAGITCWETKYFYSTWRPETAIREITASDNPAAQANPEFIPNMPSSAFPSYTSGHSTYTAAMSHMLSLCIGTDDIEFTVTSDGLPGVIRTYQKLSDARREVGMSRVWGGIHVMSDNIEGQKAGINVAEYIFAHALLPRSP